MKVSLWSLLPLLLIGCVGQQSMTKYPNPALYPQKELTEQTSTYKLSVHSLGVRFNAYEFEVAVTNNSGDSIPVNYSTFYYTPVSSDTDTTLQAVYTINATERREQLRSNLQQLETEKNPYSDSGKSTKELVSESLVTGLVYALLGADPDEIAEQNEDDEYWWDEQHANKLYATRSELDFWNETPLLPYAVPPHATISGLVLFPTSLNSDTLVLSIPIQEKLFHFKYRQLNQR